MRRATLDPASQRFYILSLWIVAQAVKGFQLGLQKNRDLLPLWIIVDTAALVLLPSLKISRLTFSPISTLVQVSIITMINWALVQDSILRLSSFLLAFLYQFILRKGEITLNEGYVRASRLLDHRNILQGQRTINIVPESMAFVEALETICFSKSQIDHFHLWINGSRAHYISYKISDLEGKSEEIRTIGKSKLKRLLNEEDDGFFSLKLPIERSGIYSVTKVLDELDSMVKLKNTRFIVPPCPSATLQYKSSASSICIGDAISIEVKIYGIPPMRLLYSSQVGTRSQTFTVDNLNPEVKSDNAYVPVEIITKIQAVVEHSSPVSFRLDAVEDAFRNRIFLRSPPVEIRPYERPHISFHSCDINHPVKMLRGSQAKLLFNGYGKDMPVDLNVSLTTSENQTIMQKHVHLASLSHALPVDQEGLYEITEVSSQHCSGTVLAPKSCVVYSPSPPSIDAVFHELQDRCSGSIGVTVDITLSGSPPFFLSYQVYRNEKVAERKRIKIDRMRHQLRFTPDVVGTYAYELCALEDLNYNDVVLDRRKFRQQQTVIPLATAVQAADLRSFATCANSTVQVPLKLGGVSPWSLVYDVAHNGHLARYTVPNITTPFYDLTPPIFTDGGDYTVSLASIQDANGCVVSLDEPDFKVTVRLQKPMGEFHYERHVNELNVLENSQVRLPVRLTGNKVCVYPPFVMLLIDSSLGLYLIAHVEMEKCMTLFYLTRMDQLKSMEKASMSLSALKIQIVRASLHKTGQISK